MTNIAEKQGWKAELNLSFKGSERKTVLSHRTQFGPLTVQRPFYPEGDVCHLYLLHPPGGVVGGDELHINVDTTDKAHALITTPGATKFYRSTGSLAKQIQTLRVADECQLEWFPQENIFFDGTHSQLTTRVELSQSARFIGWEINCYGRPAASELFNSGRVISCFQLYRDDKPLLLDRLLIDDQRALVGASSLNQYPCFGTFVATNVNTDLLQKARESVALFEGELEQSKQTQIGLTLLDDVLVVRCLANNAEQISHALKVIWSAIRPDVLGKDACHPRIWST